jgi:eukaryotic-like serine/threonine-protein kinase
MATSGQQHSSSSAGETRLIAGRFELREVLGNGGMATVYRAWDREGRQACAVKVPADNLVSDEEFRRRFRQEAEAAGALVHSRIVRVHAYGEDGPTPYMAMEHIDGGTLRDLFQRCGPLPEPLAVRLAAEVADALAYAHDRGVIHRDIKPHNILLTADRHVKVADFGIARTLGETSHTKTGSVLGSTQYISPEQARGEQAGPASDQYSLGVVLYEALAGRLPFEEAEAPVAMALKHINEPPFDLRWLRPDLSEATVMLVRRLLAKSPQDRYATAAELAAALRRIYIRFGREDTASAATAVVPLPAVDDTAAPQAGVTAVLPAAGRGRARPVPAAGRSSKGRPAVPALGRAAVMNAASLAPRSPSRSRTVRTPAFSAYSSQRRRPRAASQAALGVIGLLALWLVAGAVYQAAKSVPGSSSSRPAVSSGSQVNALHVPSLAGETLAAAQGAAAAAQLTVAVASSRQDPTAAAGMILAQDPAADAVLAKGGVIHVVVSQGSGVVPDLRGASLDDAKKQLAAAGLGLGGTSQAFDDSVAAGMIVSESPGASAHLAPHTPVDLVISQGPNTAAAPGGATSGTPDPSSDQTPASTTQAPASPAAPAVDTPLVPAVAASASTSPSAVVPNVTGVLVQQAQVQLRAARLRVGEVTYTHTSDTAAGVVIYQSRVAGTETAANGAVDLTVNQGPP